MRKLFAILFFVTAINARSQDQKVENYCQYLNQPIKKLVANLKSAVVDTRVGKTNSGKVRSLLLVFSDRSYFEIFPEFNKTDSAEQLTLRNYSNYKIKCLFYQVPGDVVSPCGCKSFAPSANSTDGVNSLDERTGQILKWRYWNKRR